MGADAAAAAAWQRLVSKDNTAKSCTKHSQNICSVGQQAANALSNRPHFNSTYLVSGQFHSKIAVLE